MTKYPKMSGKPTNTGLYKKHPMPKTQNPKRISHDMREHRRRAAVTRALST